jgi:hypothetical protein
MAASGSDDRMGWQDDDDDVALVQLPNAKQRNEERATKRKDISDRVDQEMRLLADVDEVLQWSPPRLVDAIASAPVADAGKAMELKKQLTDKDKTKTPAQGTNNEDGDEDDDDDDDDARMVCVQHSGENKRVRS